MTYWNNDKGASSVLVITLLVVLMVFGLAVLTTSLSNVRLSDKKKEWLKDYYQLEGDVEEVIAMIDGMLLETEELALKLSENESYFIEKNMETIDETKIEHFEHVNFSLYYIELLEEQCSQFEEIIGIPVVVEKSNCSAENIINGVVSKGYVITFNKYCNTENNFEKNIQVVMELVIPSEQNFTDENRLKRRYNITSYYEWQQPFEYDDGIKFENPFKD